MSTRDPLQPTSRTLHLVDVENLLGTATPDPRDIPALEAAYAHAAELGPRDHVILASSHICGRSLWYAWPGAPRRLVASGPDGADNALLAVLATEQPTERFGRVVIGSGDGGFTDAAARLQGAGVKVTVVYGVGFLARRLRMAVRDVRQLAVVGSGESAVSLRRAA